MRGRLIALEGIDGCGKSTQARLLADRIGEPLACLTREPGSTPLGARLRRLLLDPQLPEISPRAEALLMAADRAEHVRTVIGPALTAGKWVVSDRYAASTLAYQGFGRMIGTDELEILNSLATSGIEADLYVLVEVPVSVARARLEGASPDRLEALDVKFHERVADGYAKLAARDARRWVVVDGTGPADQVAERVFELVRERLGPIPEAGDQSRARRDG